MDPRSRNRSDAVRVGTGVVGARLGTWFGAPGRRRPRLLGEIVVVILLVWVYDVVRGFADRRQDSAGRHGEFVLALERLLHLDWESTGNRWLTHHPVLAVAAANWYEFAHVGVTLAVLVWCYIARPGLYRPARNALVITNLVGMAVYILLPVTPPRLMPGGDYVDTVAEAGFGTTHGGPIPADQYAAMPSLHLAWAAWVALVAGARLYGGGPPGRRLRFLWPLPYVVLTSVVVVVTANHYVLDVVAGVATALAAGRATGLTRPVSIRSTAPAEGDPMSTDSPMSCPIAGPSS